MANVARRPRIKITREKGSTRKALIEGLGEPVFYGVHGGIKHSYKPQCCITTPAKTAALTPEHASCGRAREQDSTYGQVGLIPSEPGRDHI